MSPRGSCNAACTESPETIFDIEDLEILDVWLAPVRQRQRLLEESCDAEDLAPAASS